MNRITSFLFFLLVGILMISCNSSTDQATNVADNPSISPEKGQSTVVDPDSKPNILQIAIGSKDHTTLVAAVQAAELEDILVNAGPLTVFAPTNAAFEKLPAGTVEELLKPENKEKLADIITFHASPGKYMGDMLRNNMNLYQATGHYVKVTKEGDEVSVNGAKILGTIEASNGVVHVVDQVMLPPEK